MEVDGTPDEDRRQTRIPLSLRASASAVPGDAGSGAASASLPCRRTRGSRGAVHSAEIQYAMGNLDLDKRYSWEPADYEVSKLMQVYFMNFIKTANPNGSGLPNWPAYSANDNYQLMRIDVESHTQSGSRYPNERSRPGTGRSSARKSAPAEPCQREFARY